MTNKEAQLALANLKRYISGGGAVDKSVNKAIDMAVEALGKSEPHWIPCSEELPKEEGFYLVTLGYKHGAETNIRYFKIENSERYWSKWGNENITAWMPKPIPYQQKNEVTE